MTSEVRLPRVLVHAAGWRSTPRISRAVRQPGVLVHAAGW